MCFEENMFFVLLTIQAKLNNGQLVEYDKNYIKKQLKNGKKMSELVDLDYYKQKYPQTSEFIEIMEKIEIPDSNCMSNVLKKLNYNCDQLSDDQRKRLALQFTQCYYNLTGRQHDFPFSVPEEEQIKAMKKTTYNIFQMLTLHITNMCNFARLAAFDTYNSESLVDLFESVITATEVLNETDQAIGNEAVDLKKQISEIREKLAQGNVSLAILNKSLVTFKNGVGPYAESGRRRLETIEKFKLYIVVILCTLIIAHFLPEILFIIFPLTIIVYIVDNKLTNRYNASWENSVWRTLGKTLYLTICLIYPCYTLFLTIYQSISSIIQFKSRPKRKLNVVSFGGSKRKK